MDLFRVDWSSLSSGPVRCTWRSDDPSSTLGKLPISLAWVEVEVEVDHNTQDRIWAHGTLRAAGEVECRRCLVLNRVTLETGLDVWFRPASEMAQGEESVWVYDPKDPYVDLSAALREEIWLRASEYVECAPECPGLCSGCGARLDSEECTCAPPKHDSRWTALRDVKG